MDKGRRMATAEKERAGRSGRRERVQLKLAQFSHSPVIRVRGIYIIKSRKFLSPLYRCRFCIRALVQFPLSRSLYRLVHSSLVPVFTVSSFARVSSMRPNVASLSRLSSQQGSNSGFRNELRLIALIAWRRDGFIIPSSITPSERVIIRLFKLAPSRLPLSPLCHCYTAANRVSTSVLFLRTAKIASSK